MFGQRLSLIDSPLVPTLLLGAMLLIAASPFWMQ